MASYRAISIMAELGCGSVLCNTQQCSEKVESNEFAFIKRFGLFLHEYLHPLLLHNIVYCPILFPDDQFTIPKIMKMIQNIKDWELLGSLVGIKNSMYTFHQIKQIHQKCEARREAMITLWYETHPFASWSLLHQALSMMGETEAAQAVQEQFLKGQY